MVDSHCHIAGPEFIEDLDLVIARARQAGLERCLVIVAAEDDAERRQAARVAERWPDVRFSVGVHPHAAATFAARPADAVDRIDAAVIGLPLTRALGEMGLDYHYDFSPRAVQQEVFREQVRLARRRRLPIVIHTREAEEDTLQILRDEQAREVGGVFHCFTGDRDMARRALDLDFHISISGIVTFPRALELKEVARTVPIDRLLIETDSPFLAPVPHRGGRNEPGYVARVAEVVADLRGVSVADLSDRTTENFTRLFHP